MTNIPITKIFPSIIPLPTGDCVVKGKTEKNVMLNLFQHLIEFNTYETLK